jgi:hypothetical protein
LPEPATGLSATLCAKKSFSERQEAIEPSAPLTVAVTFQAGDVGATRAGTAVVRSMPGATSALT